ncbi:MAG: helix-turn-helix domain-containing protein [Pseudomonadota bacterium]
MSNIASIPSLLNVPDRCSDCPIRNRAVCSYSTPNELAELDKIKFYRDFDPGQEIVGEGEMTQSLGSIVEGVVALHKVMEDGRRQMVGLLFPSDFLGRPLRPSAPYDAVAITQVRMCLFHRSQFEEMLSQQQTLERRLLEMMLDELDAAREWMLLLGRKTARERLASFLMILARRAAAMEQKAMSDGLTFALPLTREAIAEYLGITIETVSRQFSSLRKEGIIALDNLRTVRVLRLAELYEITHDDPADFGDGALNSA